MRLGVVFPQTEIGSDPVAIRDYAQAAEQLGYRHLVAYDHVLGANPDRSGGWGGAYTFQSPFHEPFVLFAYLAGLTSRLELVSGVLVLPQRQTSLVAKQAAALDVLSGGRLRLGVGVGWNAVEYGALGQDFHTRGRRMEEQIELLRQLWTKPLVSFEGRFDRVEDAGINPLPVQQPIPIWMGGMSEPVIRRVARMADGWFPQFRDGVNAQSGEVLEQMRAHARELGRDPAQIGIEGRVSAGRLPPDQWAEGAEVWRGLGATHCAFNSMGSGHSTPGQHIDAIRQFMQAMGGKSG